jgi:AcrR family transcriptional regulator
MPATRSRKQEYRLNIRQEVIDEANSAVLTGREFTLGEITEKLGVTKGTVYWHWRCKEELLKEAIEYQLRSFQEQLRRDFLDMPNLNGTLKQAASRVPQQLHYMQRAALTHPELVKEYKDKYIQLLVSLQLGKAWVCYTNCGGGFAERKSEAFIVWLHGLAAKYKQSPPTEEDLQWSIELFGIRDSSR